jgi:type III secretion protein R
VANFDPITLAVVLALLALLPTVVVVTTSFLKITIVMSLLRNAMGVQQIPPNLALYGLSLILSFYIMAPIGQQVYTQLTREPGATKTIDGLVSGVQRGAEPMRAFLLKHSKTENRDFFVATTKKLWPPEMSQAVDEHDFVILMPSFLVSELTEAFQIGFLLYLPFLIIDLVVSNILLAMGMMMVSPVTISMPLKLFLFVMADGWTRLIKGLIVTYT